jgi:hypothetical protein
LPSCPLSLLSFVVMVSSFFLLFPKLTSSPAVWQVLKTSSDLKKRNICIDNTASQLFLSGHKASHPHTQGQLVGACECVCVCVLLLKRRAAGEHVHLWVGFLGQTAACRLGKHQSKWLCSDVDSPATAGRLRHCKSASPCRNTEREAISAFARQKRVRRAWHEFWPRSARRV